MNFEKYIEEEIKKYFLNKGYKVNNFHCFGYGTRYVFIYVTNVFKASCWGKEKINDMVHLYDINAGSKEYRRKYHDFMLEHILPIITKELVKYNREEILINFTDIKNRVGVYYDTAIIYKDGKYEYQ